MVKPIYRVGLDIGGTFTDFVLYDAHSRRISLYKCLTTPRDPSAAALEGLGKLTAQAGIGIADIGEIVHGTTLVTNAIIERRGARLGLLTTKGFRDSLEMGTEQRYDIYDLFLGFPEPLVPATFAGGRSHLVHVDDASEIAYFAVESREESLTTAIRLDLRAREAEALWQSPYGAYVAAWSPDHSRVVFVDGYTMGDIVLYEIDEAGLAVRRADPRGFMRRFPAASEGFTNLLCVKAPLNHETA